MNTCDARSPSPPARPQEASQRLETPEDRQRGDEFERLLRERAGTRGEDRDEVCTASVPDTSDTPDDADCGVVGAALLAAPSNVAPPASPAARVPCTACTVRTAPATRPDGIASAPHAALGADLGPPLPVATSHADAAGAWEMSLHEPMGVAIELRATRPGTTAAGGAPSTWTLTIASPTLDAAVLSRHAPRLNERLRARSLVHTHLRIEDDGDET